MKDTNKVNIYCYVDVSVVGLGMVGPTTYAKIDKKDADRLIKESPQIWSLKPFETKEITEDVKNAK